MRAGNESRVQASVRPGLHTAGAMAVQAPQTRPSLAGLHDIVLPESVRWMPATTAWYVLAAAVLIALAVVVFLAMRRYEANRYRREALARMEAISEALAVPAQRDAALSQLPQLTKQVALAFSRRDEVAALSGDAWLRFLDESYEGDRFSAGPGRLLPAIAYGSPSSRAAIPETDVGELTALLRAWIKGHHVRA